MKGDPVIDVVGMSRRYGSGKEALFAIWIGVFRKASCSASSEPMVPASHPPSK